MNRPKLHEKEAKNAITKQLKSYEVGMQIPRNIYTETPEEGDVWKNQKGVRGIFKELASHKESAIEEGHLMPDHVHMMLSIPPKYSVSQVVGYIKGKSAIHIARLYWGRKRNYSGQNFWARGYYVSTVGRDEEVVREYIRNQDKEDERLDQISLFIPME